MAQDLTPLRKRDHAWRFSNWKNYEATVGKLSAAISSHLRPALSTSEASCLEAAAKDSFPIFCLSAQDSDLQVQPLSTSARGLCLNQETLASGQSQAHSSEVPPSFALVLEDSLSKLQAPSYALQIDSISRLGLVIRAPAQRLRISVPKDQELDLFLDWDCGSGALSSLRFELEENSSLRLKSIHAQGRGESRSYSALQFFIRDGAKLEHSSIQISHGDGNVVHGEVYASLLGPNAEAHFESLAVATGASQIETRVLMRHAVGATTSSQLFKSVLSDSSKSVFRGEVHIDPGADLSSAEQLSRALLLDRASQSITEPVLEIAADDVTASHGSSTGELNAEELFYMESRGIEPELARDLLLVGFLSEVLSGLEEPAVERWLLARALEELKS